MLEVANRLELERVPLSPVGKALLVIKGGKTRSGIKTKETWNLDRNQGKAYLGWTTNLGRGKDNGILLCKINLTSWTT